MWWEDTREDRRESPDLDIEPESDCRSETSGILSNGGTNTVDAEPLLDSELTLLAIVRIVLIDPVGERVSERSGIGRWIASLNSIDIYQTITKTQNTYQR